MFSFCSVWSVVGVGLGCGAALWCTEVLLLMKARKLFVQVVFLFVLFFLYLQVMFVEK